MSLETYGEVARAKDNPDLFGILDIINSEVFFAVVYRLFCRLKKQAIKEKSKYNKDTYNILTKDEFRQERLINK